MCNHWNPDQICVQQMKFLSNVTETESAGEEERVAREEQRTCCEVVHGTESWEER